jgi:hypothetical protein
MSTATPENVGILLHGAIVHNNLVALRDLIKKGSNLSSMYGSKTPVEWAVGALNTKALMLLIAGGADPRRRRSSYLCHASVTR